MPIQRVVRHDIQISANRTVTIGPGDPEDPGVWLLLPYNLLRWMTPDDARAIGTALIDVAREAEGNAAAAPRPTKKQARKPARAAETAGRKGCKRVKI